MPTKNGTKIQLALQKIIIQDNSALRVVPKPLSKQSAQSIDSDN